MIAANGPRPRYDIDKDEIGETVATFSSSRSLFSIFPAKDKQQVDHKEPLQAVVHGHFRALVLQLLQGELYILGKKALLMAGLTYTNARLLILGGALEYQRVANQLASYDTLLQQEKEQLKMIVSRIEAHHPNVLLVEESVFICPGASIGKRISLVLNVKAPLLERLICTVTPASSNMEESHNMLKFASKAKHVEIYASRIKKLNGSVPIDSKIERDASSETSDFNHGRSSSKLNDDISKACSVIIDSTQAG
ncbi:hypothetical protein BC332_23687 [Capsicum chinense]|nr:hypothetical protein BC332_23687 [Capsicum chinense]